MEISLTKKAVIEQTRPDDYAWFGACDAQTRLRYETFSVGIFKVIYKTRGSGKKGEPAVLRISGSTSFPEWTHDCATYICKGLNSSYRDHPIKNIKAEAVRLRDKFTLEHPAPWKPVE